MARPCQSCVLLTLIVFIGAGPSASIASPPRKKNVTGSWSKVPSMRHARAAHAVVSTESAIYAIAGTGGKGGGPVLAVERFDGRRWTDETTMPGEGLNAPAAVVLDGRIYVIGGFKTVTNMPADEVNTYDPKSKTWDKALQMPAPRGGHAAAVLNGLIHVVGGGNSKSTLSDHLVFDPSNNKWSTKSPLPQAMGSPALVAFDGRLYSIGGRSGPRDFSDVFIYDPAMDKWIPGPPIKPRATIGAVVYRKSIYIFGGESQADHAVLSDSLRLSPDKTTWQPIAPMPTPRSFARAVLFRDGIYVVGGSPAPQTSHAPEGIARVERLQFKSRKSNRPSS